MAFLWHRQKRIIFTLIQEKILANAEALQGVFGEQGNKAIYFRGTREQKSKTEGNRGTKVMSGNREHRKSRF